MTSLPMDLVNEILILHGSHIHYSKFKPMLEDIRLYATRFKVYRLVIEYNLIQNTQNRGKKPEKRKSLEPDSNQ